MRTVECEVVPDYDNKIWRYIRTDNDEETKTLPMSEEDMQIEADLEEGVVNSNVDQTDIGEQVKENEDELTDPPE